MMTSRILKQLLAFLLVGWSFGHIAVAAETAPNFALPTDKGTLTLADLKGKVVYLDFWASWCPPCRKSFPWMNEMESRYARQGLAVVAVNVDKNPTLAAKFLDEVPAHFAVAYDQQGTVAESYHVPGMPSSFIIDRSGKIRTVHIGFREDESSALEETLRTALRQ
jgi:thiol-disulfide isomerase/thioredoxin